MELLKVYRLQQMHSGRDYFIPGRQQRLSLWCLVFFAFTTILGWDYYGERCLEYLSNGSKKAVTVYRWLYILAVFIGPYMTVAAADDCRHLQRTNGNSKHNCPICTKRSNCKGYKEYFENKPLIEYTSKKLCMLAYGVLPYMFIGTQKAGVNFERNFHPCCFVFAVKGDKFAVSGKQSNNINFTYLQMWYSIYKVDLCPQLMK